MKRSSQSSGRRNPSKDEFALRAIFNAMFGVGIAVRNAEDAEQAIDLAAKLMTYALKRKVTSAEVKARMVELMEEANAEEAEAATKH